MCRSLCVCGLTASLCLLAWGTLSETARAGGKKTIHVDRGQELFEHVWQAGHDAQAGGDGLGPLFNERSCIACHSQGGIGGAGPNKNNVTVLTAVIPDKVADKELFQARLANLHPGFADGTSIVLHQFSTNPLAYQGFRENLLGLDPQAGADPARVAATTRVIIQKDIGGPVKTIEVDGTTLLLAERSTTPLFGMGLIDSIPQAQIEEVVAIQSRENPKVHGRFVGRFGWRGQLMTLGDFIRGACATELGLQVRTDAQAADPIPTSEQPSATTMLDLTERQCDDMTTFVAHLPAPRRLQRTDHQEVAAIRSGEQLFKHVGCAVCHRPTLGNVKGIYSDLLVHVMGAKLTDPSMAPSSPPAVVTTPSTTRYYGGNTFVSLQTPATVGTLARHQEWKTPPLWGLRDSGPYLHDGRAASVEEAIAYHGGEAADSVDQYQTLPDDARTRLLTFLSTLAAPDPSSLPKLKAAKDHPTATAEHRKPRLIAGLAVAP